MASKICGTCIFEKFINVIYEKFSGYNDRNGKRGLKRYYDKKRLKNLMNERYIMGEIKVNYYRKKKIDIYNLKN